MSETARDIVLRVGGAALDLMDGLDPLVADQHEAAASLARHGWRPPADAGGTAVLLTGWPTEAQRAQLRQELETLRLAGNPTLTTIAPVARRVGAVAGAVRLAQPPGSSAVAPFDKERFWATYPSELADELMAEYLELYQPAAFTLLHVTGVIERVERPAEPDVGRFSSRGDAVAPAAIGELLTSPGDRFATSYGWGGELRSAKLLAAMARSARALGAQAHMRRPPQELVARYYAPENPALLGLEGLEIALMRINDLETGYAELSFLAVPIPERGQAAELPQGLWLGLAASGSFGSSVPLTPAATLVVRGGATDVLPPGIEILPSGPGISVATPPSLIDIGVSLDIRPEQPWRPFGAATGSRLEIEGASVAMEALGTVDELEVRARIAVGTVKLFVDLDEADGFVKKAVPPPPLLEFDTALIWSSRTGLSFEGQGSLELRHPLDLQIGPVELQDLLVSLRGGTGTRTDLVAGLTVKASLGPVNLLVTNIGARARLTDSADSSALVAFDRLGVAFGFKPPDGAALSIDAGAVTGAGFLSFDPDRHQYAGGVDLEFAKLRLSAIGLLATRMPDGRPGFSLLVVISARFPKPIPLGFGFNLAAVGGLVGINRAVNVERMRSGLRTGSLSSILSPGDVVGNERRLLDDLGALFPVTPGRHLFGPTASLTWGTPSVVTIDLALALELPRPLRFIAAGRVRVLLPDERKPIAEINLDALGVLDTGEGSLALDAVLYDSQLAGWQLSGEMALRARWTRPSQFVMSAGGFHPRFKPPPGFPALSRMAMAIGEGKVRLRLEAYLALTSNTLQLGSRVELYAKSGDFTAEGHFSFDALVRFSPFGFELDLSLAVAIRWKSKLLLGITADLFLSGPGRWQVRGHATIKFLFLKATVRFKGTFGTAEALPPAPPEDVAALVRGALAEAGAWAVEERAALPALTLRPSIAAPGLLVSPSAQISVRQKIAPLAGTHLDRFGQVEVRGDAELRIDSATLGGVGAATSDVKDEFAPAQFFDLSDEEKLSSPSFDLMASGVSFTATEGVAYDPEGPEPIVIGYQTRIVDAPDAPARALYETSDGFSSASSSDGADSVLSGADLDRLAHDGAAGRAATRATGLARFDAPGLDVRVEEEAHLVVSASTLHLSGPQPLPGERWSHSEAAQRLRRWRLDHPDDDLIVVPAHEAVVGEAVLA